MKKALIVTIVTIVGLIPFYAIHKIPVKKAVAQSQYSPITHSDAEKLVKAIDNLTDAVKAAGKCR